MKKELKNDLVVAYNEIKMAIENIQGIDLWTAQEACKKALYWLSKHVDDEDILSEKI